LSSIGNEHEEITGGLQHFERVALDATSSVDDKLRQHLTLDIRRPEHVG